MSGKKISQLLLAGGQFNATDPHAKSGAGSLTLLGNSTEEPRYRARDCTQSVACLRGAQHCVRLAWKNKNTFLSISTDRFFPSYLSFFLFYFCFFLYFVFTLLSLLLLFRNTFNYVREIKIAFNIITLSILSLTFKHVHNKFLFKRFYYFSRNKINLFSSLSLSLFLSILTKHRKDWHEKIKIQLYRYFPTLISFNIVLKTFPFRFNLAKCSGTGPFTSFLTVKYKRFYASFVVVRSWVVSYDLENVTSNLIKSISSKAEKEEKNKIK